MLAKEISWKSLAVVFFAVLLILAAVQSCGTDDNGNPKTVNKEALVRDLTDKGFQVNEGYPRLYTQKECEEYTYPLMKNCYLNNPAAPYVIPVMKTWPDEYIDPATVNAFGYTEPGYSSTYRLDPQEAILIYGQLPPPGKYTSLQTWVFSQDGKWKSEDYDHYAEMADLVFPIQYLFDTVPPYDTQSERVQSLSALSNIINNVVIERQSGSAFGKMRYFIITPDANMEQALRSELQDLGIADRYIFTERIPSGDEFGVVGPIGLDEGAIDFLTAIRYAIPDAGYADAAQAWRAHPPFTVLRVRGFEGAAKPYPSLVFDPRTAVDERGLAGDLQALLDTVCERARSLGFESNDCGNSPTAESFMKDLPSYFGWNGPYCRAVGMNCLADQQDASYFFSEQLPIDSGEVYAVIGTHAKNTGNATYGALSVNDPSIFKGASNLMDTDLQGSASAYKDTVNNTDKFFVHYFARDCKFQELENLADGQCTEISEDVVPRAGDTTAQGDPALFGMFIASVRAYVCPGTERGPDATKQLAPRILKFTRQ